MRKIIKYIHSVIIVIAPVLLLSVTLVSCGGKDDTVGNWIIAILLILAFLKRSS